jgi:ankyrin repeat protein
VPADAGIPSECISVGSGPGAAALCVKHTAKVVQFTETQADIAKQYAKLLLERGLARTSQEAEKQAFLMWALDFGSVSQIEEALAQGGDPNLIMPRGDTPLGKVSGSPDNPQGSRAPTVRILLRAGADPNLPSEGKLPLAIAIARAHTDVVEVLIDVTDRQMVSRVEIGGALVAAAANGSLSLVRRLLAEGVPPDSTGPRASSITPLMMAAAFGHVEVVQALLAAGADVNTTDLEGQTALDHAFHDLTKGKKTFPILQQAGGVFGGPRQREGDAIGREFRVAAQQPTYKEALEKITHLTGVSPAHLRNSLNAEIPGGYGFSLAEGRARSFVEEHQAEFFARGICLFSIEDTVAVLPTSDVYQAIAAVGTTGANSGVYNEDLIIWLRELEKEQPFRITGIGPDSLEGKFTTTIKDPVTLVRKINELCPDGDEGPDAETKQVNHLKKTSEFCLWWD